MPARGGRRPRKNTGSRPRDYSVVILGGKMLLNPAIIFCLLAGLAASVAGFAQEGHPLTGVWYGDWGPNSTQRNHLTIQMQWDGKNVTGIVNPGPDSFPLKV